MADLASGRGEWPLPESDAATLRSHGFGRYFSVAFLAVWLVLLATIYLSGRSRTAFRAAG